MRTIYEQAGFEGAFLVARLNRLTQTLESQAGAMAARRGLTVPVQSNASVVTIALHGPLTLTELARRTGDPHQLAAYRVNKLIRQGLVEKRADARDGRRFPLTLTPAGHEQADILIGMARDVARIYAAVADEVGVNLNDVLDAVQASFERRPLVERDDVLAEVQPCGDV
ncbi:MarR family transcriptional regulator [uncultured Maricaulis sp.]|uniref:MarR family winged helix-turn-helix transcriptional regulator n=1 Tax=uncultured Maricaulis sp. TaxID=174710 RepID=UPI00261CF53C|nr:MarR family transcriptional regulator [uncultured Maricaulis sp.]